MIDAAKQIEALRNRIAGRNEPGAPADYINRLSVTISADLFNLDFYGDPLGDCYDDLLTTVSQPAVAPHIRSLIIGGPDEGANGTQNWNLEPMLATGVTFPHLEALVVRQNKPGDHNRIIIGRDYSEDGVLGRLLLSAPALRELTTPSAPSSSFFGVPPRPLHFLSVDAGYDTQTFIRNLAQSKVFPALSSLEWGEYNETYMENWRSSCTPFEDYEALFASESFASVKAFVWRNPVCSTEEIKALKLFRPGIQLQVVRSSASYI